MGNGDDENNDRMENLIRFISVQNYLSLILLLKIRVSSNFLYPFSVSAEKLIRNIMKKILIALLLITALMLQSWTQEPENNQNGNTLSDTIDNTKVVIGRDFIVVDDHKDTVDVKVGDKGISILESLEGKGGMAIRKYDSRREHHLDFNEWNSGNDNDRNSDNDNERRSRKFKGHWTGVELGFNNYLSSEKNMVLPAEIGYMTLHSGKSVNFNVNFAQLSLGLTRHIGFVTGLGVNWNNYNFFSNNNIVKGENGVIEALTPLGNLEKSKLATVYLTLPFMLEFQLPVNNGHLNIAGGPIGAVKVSSQ